MIGLETLFIMMMMNVMNALGHTIMRCKVMRITVTFF